MRTRPTRFRTAAVVCACIALFTAGLVLRRTHARHIADRPWTALELPIRFTAGARYEGRFAAAHSGRLEIELSVMPALSEEQLSTYITSEQRPSALNLAWRIREGEATVAAGDCVDYLYAIHSSVPWKKRLKNAAYSVPFHRGERTGAHARGVGSFPVEAGKTYTLEAQVGSAAEGLDEAEPLLIVRPSRLTWQRHARQTLALAETALWCWGVATLAAGAWIVYAVVLRFLTLHPKKGPV